MLVIVDGERAGTGTADGSHVTLDPPLDTLTPASVDSTAYWISPLARQLYLLPPDEQGVVFLWTSAGTRGPR